MYKLLYDSMTGKVTTIMNSRDSIPLCEENTDYQEFIKWNGKQKKPLDLNSTITPPEPTEAELYEARVKAKEKELVRDLAVKALETEGIKKG